MSGVLLTTKLQVPQLRKIWVHRPHLVGRLQSSLDKKLILISAPAGYGKTCLVLDWLSTYKNQAAWVSLDDADNDPVRFWSYIHHALIKTFLLPENLTILNFSPFEINLTEHLNAIELYQSSVILVIDDYHIIHSQIIHDGISFLINYAPENFHLILLTRADPPLPLAKLRSHSQMAEFRMADLCFSKSEVNEFMHNVMHLSLSESDLLRLEESTEGWVAGLQMIGLSLQGRQNYSDYIRSISGEDRYIMDFLFEEVFSSQSEEIQKFLLQTAILNRLSDSLCNAITQTQNSQEKLIYLERNNLFLISVDGKRKWFRYHHFFLDLLRNRLKNSSAFEIKELHSRASSWYEIEGDLDIAIDHALAANDFEHMAILLEKISQNLDFQNQQTLLNSWLDRLPRDVIKSHPWLCVYKAWGSYWTGHRNEEFEEWLQAAENNFSHLFDDTQRRILSGYISTIRAHTELLINKDASLALKLANNALELLPDNDRMRCEAAIASAGSYWALGDVELAKKAFGKARDSALRINYLSMAAGSTVFIRIQLIKQGYLNEALATFQSSLKMSVLPGGKEMAMAGFANCRLGDVWREKNCLMMASDYLSRGVLQCEELGQPDILSDAYVCLARYKLACGDIDETHKVLEKVERLAYKSRVDPWILCWIDDCRIRAWQAVGDYEAIKLWQQNTELSFSDSFEYQRDLHHQNLARVLVINQIRNNLAAGFKTAKILLDRLQIAAKFAGWVHEEIKILVLATINFKSMGFVDDAVINLVHAIILAQPGGYIRIFLDEGETMHEMFRILSRLSDEHLMDLLNKIKPTVQTSYIVGIKLCVSKMIEEFGQTFKEDITAKKGQNQVEAVKYPYHDPFVEKLTEREMEVLQLITQGFQNKIIAERLFITPDTVHQHLKNIYSKLDVHSRVEAVIRAQALKII